MARYEPVDSRQSFPALEEGILERWRERDVFHESVRRREGAEPFVFYEGPPTANGRPGSHHVLARVFKDVFPRYQTMRGRQVRRKGGWDCHGLPVELEIEKELGLAHKRDIEDYGIDKFNAKCRESVLRYIDEWNRLTERIGFWIDADDAYFTLDDSYVESVWWTLKQVWDKGLLYEGNKVGPYCPRCGTGLSSHEVAQGYKDVVDPSIYVRFPLLDDAGADAGEALLVWTTTPWTLPGNVAVAVAPQVTYVRARAGDETLVLAEPLVAKVLGDDAEIVETFPASALIGRRYRGPVFALADGGPANSFTVIAGDFVTTEDGTGLVHLAPAFGEDDFDAAAAAGIFDPADQGGPALYNPVKRDGTFDERVTGFEGRFVKDAEATAALISDLEGRGLLFKAEDYEHCYPHCWRCHTPLLYYAKSSWYVRTTAVKDELLAANEAVTWYPEHIKHGRFGNWLENNVDWALSRERYWGTPLPIWRSEDGEETICVGSRAELAELTGGELPEDLHRPYVDDVVFERDGKTFRRVPDLIDVWWDSGAMPFAQWHYPFENEERFEQSFPADYICEGLDQTRGWFYSLLAISTMLRGRASYEKVLCLGLIVDENGQKMSKSKGNVVVPWEVLDQHGADAFRWYYFTSKQPWDGYRFSLDTVGESVRQFMKPLWNTYSLFVLYANVNDVDAVPLSELPAIADPNGPDARPALTDLDLWILSRLQATTATVIDRLDDYDTTTAGRAIAAFVDELSNWYVRRSRRRFWDGDPAAFATLRECLVTTAKLLAPLTPFVADAIYENLDGSEPSVHLCDFPEPDAALRDERLEDQMQVVRDAVELGRAARAAAKAKVRQPLSEAVVVAADRERDAIGRFEALVLDELNVKQVRYVSQADELGRFELKPNYRTLGPRFGKDMPKVADAVAGLDANRAAATLRDGGEVHVAIDGRDHPLGADDISLALQPLDGYEVERAGTHAVALNLELDDDLRREALAREIVHAIQNARKDAGLDVQDRISLTLGGDDALLDAVRAHEAYVTGETLATSLDLSGDPNGGATAELEGRTLSIAVARA
ncbi:MAG TPA: isoleucine--tRNA ligase [Thermoleophilaceae bacterium]|nr:isoleucine--tRNA ligase [Thermoleophilaceae bacterium]